MLALYVAADLILFIYKGTCVSMTAEVYSYQETIVSVPISLNVCMYVLCVCMCVDRVGVSLSEVSTRDRYIYCDSYSIGRSHSIADRIQRQQAAVYFNDGKLFVSILGQLRCTMSLTSHLSSLTPRIPLQLWFFALGAPVVVAYVYFMQLQTFV
jgi:hypothetical protein